MTIIVNLVGGPCCGKSTTAAGLFSTMKLQTTNKVELVTEVIKDHVYDENKGAMQDQVLLTAEQNHRFKRLDGKVDFVISDASLLNAIVYNQFYNQNKDISTELSRKLFEKYDNVVFFLPRKPQYDAYGRTQSEEDARFIDELFESVFWEYSIPFIDMREYTHDVIPEKILEKLQEKFGSTVTLRG